jgi:hypothetical protein
MDINQFIIGTIRQRIKDASCNEKDDLIIEACNEYSESTCGMVWKEVHGNFNDEAIFIFLTDEKCRTNLKEKMANVEKIGRNLSEIDWRVNMNATPEEFAKYLMKHNICITEEIFEEFKSMNRFRSFSDYIRKHRIEMGLKVFFSR